MPSSQATAAAANQTAMNSAIAAFQAAFQEQNSVDLINGQLPSNQSQSSLSGQPMGRQGAIKDVKSIIEDYRQKHPETIPRRGRRMKSVLSTHNSNSVNSSSLGNVSNVDVVGGNKDLLRELRKELQMNPQLQTRSDWSVLLGLSAEGNSRPSSTDSTHSNTSSSAINNILLQHGIVPSATTTAATTSTPIPPPPNGTWSSEPFRCCASSLLSLSSVSFFSRLHSIHQ